MGNQSVPFSGLRRSPAPAPGKAGLAEDEIERIEEGGTEPAIPLLRRLAAALHAEVRLTAGDDVGSVWFEPRRVRDAV